MQLKFPLCHKALKNPYHFRYHFQKIRDDKELLQKLFDTKDYLALYYLEQLYAEMTCDPAPRKDIMSRSWPKRSIDDIY